MILREDPDVACVILAEDCDEVRDLYAATLRAAGHEVFPVADGRKALDALAVSSGDVVVSDLFMPDCDGIELIRAIRNAGYDVPIVAVSSGFRGSRDMYLEMAKALGANVVATKPLSPQGLVDAVAAALTKQAAIEAA